MRNWNIVNSKYFPKYYSEVFRNSFNEAYNFMLSTLGQSYGLYLRDIDIELKFIDDDEEMSNSITGYCIEISDGVYRVALAPRCIERDREIPMTLIHELCHIYLTEYYKKSLLNYENDGSTIFVLFNLYCQLRYDKDFRYSGTYVQHNKVYNTDLYWECMNKGIFNMDIYYMMKFLDSVVNIYEDITRKLYRHLKIHLLFTSDEKLTESKQRSSLLSVRTFKPDTLININNLLDIDELDSICEKIIATHNKRNVPRGTTKPYYYSI